MFIRPLENKPPERHQEKSQRSRKSGESEFAEILDSIQAVDWVEISKDRDQEKRGKKRKTSSREQTAPGSHESDQDSASTSAAQSGLDIAV